MSGTLVLNRHLVCYWDSVLKQASYSLALHSRVFCAEVDGQWPRNHSTIVDCDISASTFFNFSNFFLPLPFSH